jgi:multiple sugar transport system permease protein
MMRRILVITGYSVLILFALFEVVPFVLTISNSFKCLPATREVSEAFIPMSGFIDCHTESGGALSATETTTGLGFNPTTEGFNKVLDQYPFPRWFFNSFMYAALVTIVRLALDSLAGYALARMDFPGRRMMFFILLGTMMIPGIVLLIPRFIILRQLGILNTFQGDFHCRRYFGYS